MEHKKYNAINQPVRKKDSMQLLLGKPVTIIRNGEILQDELAQLRITASDLAEALRGKDIFSPKDVYWGVIEPNGSITAAPMPQDRDIRAMTTIRIPMRTV